jgi:transcriptional regulator with XRE-family HTH domain
MQLSTVSTNSRINPVVTGKELRDYREKLGLTQKELADKLGVAMNTVSRWELEERKIPEFLSLALKTVERELPPKSNN